MCVPAVTTQTARALGLIQANGTTAPVPTPAPTPAPSPSSSGTGTVPVSTVPNLGAAIATTPDLSQLLVSRRNQAPLPF